MADTYVSGSEVVHDGFLNDSAMAEGDKNLRQNESGNPLVLAGSGVLLGYARVSTTSQGVNRQVDALTGAGVESSRVFIDRGLSGGLKSSERPAQNSLMAHVRDGDVVLVQSLDRAGRRAADLLAWVDEIHERGASLRVLNLGVDTRSPMGKLVLGVVASLAEAERALIRERVISGLEAARKRGRVGGRKPVLDAAQKSVAVELVAGGKTAVEVAEILRVSERTIRRVLASHRSESPKGATT